MSKKGSKKKKLAKYFEAQFLGQQKSARRREKFKTKKPPPLWLNEKTIY